MRCTGFEAEQNALLDEQVICLKGEQNPLFDDRSFVTNKIIS